MVRPPPLTAIPPARTARPPYRAPVPPARCCSLTNPAADRVRHKQYTVDLGAAGGSLRCAFSATRDVLFLLLQREV